MRKVKKKTRKKETLNLRTITSVMIGNAQVSLSALEKINHNLNALIGAMTEIIAIKAQINRIELEIIKTKVFVDRKESESRIGKLFKKLFFLN